MRRMTDRPLIDPSIPPSGPGCAECLATADGWWFHLRRCTACGHVGCCDSSPSQHASRHASETGHRIVRSYEPEEEWFWDYVAQRYAHGPALEPPDHHPLEQSVPGPADRVPEDWQERLN